MRRVAYVDELVFPAVTDYHQCISHLRIAVAIAVGILSGFFLGLNDAEGQCGPYLRNTIKARLSHLSDGNVAELAKGPCKHDDLCPGACTFCDRNLCMYAAAHEMNDATTCACEESRSRDCSVS